MRRHLITLVALTVVLTALLSAPIAPGPAPAFAKRQFEQPEREREGDPEDYTQAPRTETPALTRRPAPGEVTVEIAPRRSLQHRLASVLNRLLSAMGWGVR